MPTPKSTIPARIPPFALLGALLAGVAVALGAFAAHGLKSHLDTYSQGIWETAVRYQFWHALGLLALEPLAKHHQAVRAQRLFLLAGRSFFAGVALFSGSLYVLALSGVKALGMITPLGGVAFLVGWVALAMAVAPGVARRGD